MNRRVWEKLPASALEHLRHPPQKKFKLSSINKTGINSVGMPKLNSVWEVSFSGGPPARYVVCEELTFIVSLCPQGNSLNNHYFGCIPTIRLGKFTTGTFTQGGYGWCATQIPRLWKFIGFWDGTRIII